MFNRDALFGNRQPPPPGQRQQPGYPDRSQQQPPSHGQEKPVPSRGRLRLRPVAFPDKNATFSNICMVNPQEISLPQNGEDPYLLINGKFVLSARPHPNLQRGELGLNEIQRTWMQVTMTDTVEAEPYDPFRQGSQGYLGSIDVEVGFASRMGGTDAPFDQDQLADAVVKAFRNQIFAPGQGILFDFRGTKLKLTIRTVELVDLASLKTSGGTSQTRPDARGILVAETSINFYKDAKSPINLKASTRRPAANSVIRPDFKFEDMGIGGLDKEFSDIFRRAFASRIFPPGLAEKLGIQHVRGMLLYGPPGTGKTLIARQIGKMLNAREPKVINGPEVLNKYVGQSEENIRKMFADAEKEQKEKGDESGLHIVIFDELDAVCKQRGSGAGGGTGVGDSVVNQLLSKLDGVDQLNNILLIGMTNRKDMIDEALLRPGRLEVHLEISLPDEPGRQQILRIHTTKMRDNGVLGDDVDIAELARLTRNYSGAEISGLVKAASSFAFQRHIKGGTVAALKDDIHEMKIYQEDFLKALQEVKPLFGVSEEVLDDCVRGGIIHYGPSVEKILRDGRSYVEQVRTGKQSRLLPVLIHGPRYSGKTALAARIALDSKFPFIKLISPADVIGMNEIQKIQYLSKVFTDAYKSPLNVLVLDNIENLIDWVPIGPRFSAAVLSALKALMAKQPPENRPLLILATTSQRTVMQQLELDFNFEIPVPSLRTQQELHHVMKESGAFDEQAIRRAIGEIEAVTGAKDIGVGIKQILLAMEGAVLGSDDPPIRFAEIMCSAIGNA
jgi:vesicle-fusing ATPase